MPMIREMIVVTSSADGSPHIAPLGLIQQDGFWVAAPFRPSQTLNNLLQNPFFTASVTDDVRVYAGCLTGRRDWPLARASAINGWRLEDAVSHFELAVDEREDDELRPRFRSKVVHEASHKAAPGFNRAQFAVIEAAILTSRLHMLSESKVRSEMAYLEIGIEKTAGDREKEAWSWLKEKIGLHLAASAQL